MIGLVLATAGCATLAPSSEPSARAMADATAHVYGVPPIEVLVGRELPGIGGTYRKGIITVSTQVASSRFRDSVVAHEMAHYLLGHDASLRGKTTEELERELVERELDANAKAVEILGRVKGMSEEEALRVMYAHLLSAHRAAKQKRLVVPWGHLSPCAEIADLLSRFPAQAAWTARSECARGW